jgi:hypothetical protein
MIDGCSSLIASESAACGRFRFLVSVASRASTLRSSPGLARFESSDRVSAGDRADGSDADLGKDGLDGFVTDSVAVDVEKDSAVRRGIASRMKRLREGFPYVTILRGIGAAGAFRDAMAGFIWGL